MALKLLLILSTILFLTARVHSESFFEKNDRLKTTEEILKLKQEESVTDKFIQRDALNDLGTSFVWMFKGAYYQFSQINNLYYLPFAVGSTSYAFEHDERISNSARSRKLEKHIDTVGNLGVVFNFPFFPVGFYYYGRYNNSPHAVQFAMEYFAALYLALGESGLLSFIDVHERPVTSKLSVWETDFRGKSSWPSGHTIPYQTLFFKTLQFYGPWWSILPFIAGVWTSQQRVQDGKHWPSDVVASFWLSAFASEGVRAVGRYKHNHPFYKWVFERDAQLGLIKNRDAYGPRIVWNF